MSDESERGNNGRFLPGNSGVGGGRKKGLERLVREIVGDNIVAMTEAQIAIAMGIKPKGCEDIPPIKASDMTKAYDAVVDRGWGKARQIVEIGNGPSVDDDEIAKMTDEQLADYIRKQEQLASEETSDPPPAASSGEG